MPYYFRNSEYDKTYGTLRNVLPNMARVKQYDKHMVTPKIGCSLGCHPPNTFTQSLYYLRQSRQRLNVEPLCLRIACLKLTPFGWWV